jgi:hypothetical protein
VTRLVGLVGATVSFDEGSELLLALAGVDVPTKHVERGAESLGEEIAQDEKQVVEPVPDDEVAPTMYLGMDGTGIPMRTSELKGRAGKQADGSSKTREVKLCTVWSAESIGPDGVPQRDPGSVTYSAAIESAASNDVGDRLSDFTKRVLREATRRGFERAARRVVIGDGAMWIWNLADEHFPDAIQVVDIFHAKQHLSDVAKAVYGHATDTGRQWERLRYAELDAGNLHAILDALLTHASDNDEARKCAEYVQRNRHRMGYPDFRAQGLCVCSGVVEAGCKVAIGTRLKRAGMHWTLRGANNIAALRCSKLSARFEDFWERRALKTSHTASV